ncbi:ATP-binding protein [Falsiroseomonas sp. HW251]|uniref:ATP-binding protein n=1 Tax=Falsiroseomonas sp. HW251 TaxID=3390998 RepID=UPI003D3135E5
MRPWNLPARWRRALHGMRLSTRLILIVATCLLPTLLLQVVVAWQQWTDRKAQLGAIVTQQAQLLAGNVDSIAEGARILLGAAAEFRQVRERDVSCGDRLARLLHHAPGFAFIAVIEPDGAIRCASQPDVALPSESSTWQRAASGTTGFAAGRFTRSRLLPTGFLPFTMPITEADQTRPGLLVAGLDLHWLELHLQGLKRTGLPFLASGVLTVADADGVVLGRDVKHADFVGQRFPQAALSLLQATAPGTLRLRSMDGTDRLVGFSPPTEASHGLAAVVGVHEPDLMTDIEAALRRGALLLLAVTLLAVALTLAMARRFITGPTAALLDVARRWQDGDLSARAPACGRGSEFAQLATAYNEMAASLERREAGLHAAVEERTRALTAANERLQAEIDERRQAEAALVQAQKVQAVGQLAGGIAHDFNNVLQAVIGGVALIRKRAADTSSVQRLAGMIDESARRGQSITRRLLAFSRQEQLRAGPLDLNEMLEGLREVLSATLGARIRVQVDAPSGLPTILVDRGQLETVLVNLATNARDAMPKGGTLRLSVVVEEIAEHAGNALAPGRYVRLAAADTGEGMDEATLRRAAEPFFTTKPLGQGTGLGLAMARSFAQASGGRLDVASTPGRGTTVTIWLPIVVEAPRPQTDSLAHRALRRGSDDRTPRLLLVDDEPMVREVLAAELQDAGYEVAQAADGVAALALLDGERCFDLLVSDLAMPGMDGVSVIREAQRRHPCLPAILLTGYAGDAATLAVSGALGGRFMLLRKPISGAELADHAAALMDDAARDAQPAH